MKTFDIQLYVERNNCISDYKMVQERTGEVVFELRGRFTKGQLKAMVDSLELENKEFELPNSFVV